MEHRKISWNGKRVLSRQYRLKLLPLLLALVLLVGMLVFPGAGAEEAAVPSAAKSQVVSAGETKYYNADGGAADAGSYAVSVNKTIKQGANENLFDVDLTVETETNYTQVKKSLDSAVVALVDLSTSMLKCAECGESYHNSSHTYDHSFKSRYDSAKEVFHSFLTKYVAGAGEADAYLAVVAYGSSFALPDKWEKVSDMTPAEITNYVNSIFNGNTLGATATPVAFEYARDLLEGTYRKTMFDPVVNLPISDVRRCAVISLTDGSPNENTYLSLVIPKQYESQYQAATAYLSDLAKTDAKFALTYNKDKACFNNVAALAYIIRAMDVPVYSVIFAAGGMGDSSATNFPASYLVNFSKYYSTSAYDAQNSDKLNIAFSDIVNQITQAKPNTVTDILPSWLHYVSDSFVTTDNGGALKEVSHNDGIISWTLAGSSPTNTTGGRSTYHLSYQVTLDNTGKDAPQANVGLDVNTTAPTFSYYMYSGTDTQSPTASPLRTVKFAVPQVKSYEGVLTFLKVAPDNEPILKQGAEASQFAVYLQPDDAAPFTTGTNDGEGWIVFEKALPSGHTYTLKETKAPDSFVLDESANTWPVEVAWGTAAISSAGAPITSITNYFDTKEKDFTIRKIWNDETGYYQRDGVSVVCTIRYTMDGKPKTEVVTLSYANRTADNDKIWETTVKLPTCDKASGTELSYEIAEAPLPGCTADYLIDSAAHVMTIQNSVSATLDITVTKEWVDPAPPLPTPTSPPENDDDSLLPEADVPAPSVLADTAASHPDVTINLYAGDSDDIVDTATLSSGERFVTFQGVPMFDALGREIIYRVGEVPLEGYRLSGNTGDQKSGFVLTNTSLGCNTVDVPLHVHWYDEGNESARPETVSVFLEESTDGTNWTKAADTEKTLSISDLLDGRTDVWAWVYTGMPQYTSSNQKITYRVRQEGSVPDYYTEYSTNGVDINETYDLTSVTVRKEWVKPVELPTPDVTFVLKQDGVEYSRQTLTAPAASCTFSGLPVFKGGTEKYVYTVEEEGGTGYTPEHTGTTFTNTIINDNNVKISGQIKWELRGEPNTPLPEKVVVQLWANGQPAKRPDGTTVELEATAENGWRYEFTGAPRYSTNGLNVVSYSVRELDADKKPAPDSSTILFDVSVPGADGQPVTERHDFGAHYYEVVRDADGNFTCNIRNHTNAEIKEYVSRIDCTYTYYLDGVEKSSTPVLGKNDVREASYTLTFDTRAAALAQYGGRTYGFVDGSVSHGGALRTSPASVVPGENSVSIAETDGVYVVTLNYALRESSYVPPYVPPTKTPSSPPPSVTPSAVPSASPTPTPTPTPTPPVPTPTPSVPVTPTPEPTATPTPAPLPSGRPTPPPLTPEEQEKVDKVVDEATKDPDIIIRDRGTLEELYPELDIDDLPIPLYWGPDFAVIELPDGELIVIDSDLVPLGALPQTGAFMNDAGARLAVAGLLMTAAALVGGAVLLRRREDA